jgi:hypothetical protein
MEQNNYHTKSFSYLHCFIFLILILFKFQLADAEQTAQEFYEEIGQLKLKIEVSFHASR